MISVLAPAGAVAALATVPLDEAEAHHLKVRRAAEGDPVKILDGAGTAGWGRLVRDAGGFAVVVERVEHAARPPDVTLIVGAGDRERFGWLAEKTAELGVTDLIPLESDRTRSVGSRVQGHHVEALNRRALQAIKQSGAMWAPIVHLPLTLPEVAARAFPGARWLADPDGGAPALPIEGDAVTTVVGPEGGLTTAERDVLLGAGYVAVRLAPAILRFETAALVAAALAVGRRPRRSDE